jgi:hypothetical protein
MPWKETRAMDNRLNFISAWLRRDEPMGALCQRYGISRKTGYKWLERYRQAGVVGLADLSSARHTQAHAMDEATADAILAFRQLHRTWGPRKLLVELNGSPFARRDGLGGLTQLSVWLLKLDVWPERITPGCPQQNGRPERMHRVLHEDAAAPPAATAALQQDRLDSWRLEYNTVRPHEALGMRYPHELYTRSERDYPAKIAAWDYPADHQVRRVISDGYIKWRDGTVYLTGALRGETVGVAQRDDGDWAVRFRGFDLAVLPDDGGELVRCGLSRMALYSVT